MLTTVLLYQKHTSRCVHSVYYVTSILMHRLARHTGVSRLQCFRIIVFPYCIRSIESSLSSIRNLVDFSLPLRNGCQVKINLMSAWPSGSLSRDTDCTVQVVGTSSSYGILEVQFKCTVRARCWEYYHSFFLFSKKFDLRNRTQVEQWNKKWANRNY